MSQLNMLITRGERLLKELAPLEKADEAEKGVDEFTSMKRNCSKQVAEVRELITQRDELLSKKGASKDTVEMSAHVRTQLRSLKDNYQRMREVHETAQKKAKKARRVTPQADHDARAAVLDLLQQHITECEQLEKKRFANTPAAKAELAAGVPATSHAVKRSAMVTDLRDLDDPELEKGLQQLAAQDAEIDAQLDQLSKGVGRLKAIALDMNTEIKVQNAMVAEITEDVDKVTNHILELNVKVKAALEKVGGAQRIIVLAILFVLILSIAIYAYTIMKPQFDGSNDTEVAATPAPKVTTRRVLSSEYANDNNDSSFMRIDQVIPTHLSILADLAHKGIVANNAFSSA